MSVAHSLNFVWTPASLAVSGVVLCAAACLCWLGWRRSGYRRSQGLLEMLRFLLVAFTLVLFNQPEWLEHYQPTDEPALAVLWDATPSMDTRDATAAEGTNAGAPVTRLEAIAPLVEPGYWRRMEDTMSVVLQPITPAPASGGTDLHAPLIDAMERIPNLRAAVLISDGDWTAGAAPVEAAVRLRVANIPVFVVPVGSRTPLPDLELVSLDAPTFGVKNKSVRVPFTIASTLPRDHVTTLVLKVEGGEEVSRELRIPAMSRITDAIEWRPTENGDFTLTLSVPVHGEEIITGNNILDAPIAIRDEKLRVLLVDSVPRWEYRYLRNALSRDPGIELSCLLFHPGLSKRGGGNKDYIQEFPGSAEALTPYDVVFLGDVGIDDGQLSPEQCRLLRGLVEHQASGLVFIPGFEGRQLSLLATELDDLYPVVLDPALPGGVGALVPGSFALTEQGRRSLLTKLADTEDENIDVWDALPGFQWHAAVVRAKAGTEVLATHAEAGNEFGRLPLLVTRTYGAGKVLFMGTDGAWRWRKGVEDRYHYRFWGQVVRWMAYSRNIAKGETLRLYYSPDQPRLHQTVTLSANAMEPGGEPLNNGELTARITAPSGQVESVRLSATGDEWGAYSTGYIASEPGAHRITLRCKETNASLETTFFVHGTTGEQPGRPARPEVLEEIARITHGAVLDLHRGTAMLEGLSALERPPVAVHRVQLWCHPVVAAFMVALLSAFWIARKAAGLI